MKTSNLTLVVCLTICRAANAQKNNAEWDAIRKVIDTETRSFFEKKYDKWSDTWMHDSSIFIIRAYPTSNSQMYGWNTISKNYKETMQNFPVFTEEQILPYMNKMNYRYSINGNMATVSFKEGKTEKEATDETRIMVKQNGVWKTAGMTLIGTAEYNLKNAFNNLKSLIGNWKMDAASYKAEPAQNGTKIESGAGNVHETLNGVEMVTHLNYISGDQRYSSTEYEQFIHDFGRNEIKYIHITKSFTGETYTQVGKVEINNAGDIYITILDEDKPTVKQAEGVFALQKDGTLQIKNKWFGSDGKQQGSNSFTLHRL